MKDQMQKGSILLITTIFLAGFILIVMMSVVISDNQLQRAHHAHKESKRYFYSNARLQQLKAAVISKNIALPLTKVDCGEFDDKLAKTDLTAWHEDPLSQGDLGPDVGIFIQSECQRAPVFVIGQQPELVNQMQTVYLGSKINVHGNVYEFSWLNFNMSYSEKLPESLENTEELDIDDLNTDSLTSGRPQKHILKILLRLESNDQIVISSDHIVSRITHTSAEDQYHWSVDLKLFFTLTNMSATQLYIVNKLDDVNSELFVIVFSKPLLHCVNSCEQLHLALINNQGIVLQHFTMLPTESFSEIKSFAISQNQLILINASGEVFLGQLSHSQPIQLELQRIFTFNVQEKTQIDPLWFETNLDVISARKKQVLEESISNIRLNFRLTSLTQSHFFSLIFDLKNHPIPFQSTDDLYDVVSNGEVFYQNILIRLRQPVKIFNSSWQLAFNIKNISISEQLQHVWYVNDLIVLHTTTKKNTEIEQAANWIYVLKKTGENWLNQPDILAFSVKEHNVVIKHQMIPQEETIYLHPKCQVPNFSIMINNKYMIGCSTHQLIKSFK